MATIEPVNGDRNELVPLVAAAFACDAAVARAVSISARMRDHPARCTIIDYDERDTDVHLMALGHTRMICHSLDGRMVVVEDYEVGDLFGIAGLFDARESPTQVCAVTNSRTGAIASHAFIALMSAHPAIALGLSRMVIARLAAANRRVAEFATLSAVGRVHAELLRRARAAPNLTIAPAPIFAEFALAVQSTRETVSRAINALEKRGIVKRQDDTMVIVAPHRLEELIY